MKKNIIIGFCSVALLSSACTKPGETTGYASAAGGAIGAGLGAIVGSQVGSAGAGLAIGAAAGAGAGYAVGNALEAHEKRMAVNEERLNRQDVTIRTQKNEIHSLRLVEPDTASSSTSGNRFASNSSSYNSGSGGASRFDTGGVRFASPSEISAAQNRRSYDSAPAARVQLNSNYNSAAFNNSARSDQAAPSSSGTTTNPRLAAPLAPGAAAATAGNVGSSTGFNSIHKDDGVTEKNLLDVPTSSISANGTEETLQEAPAKVQPVSGLNRSAESSSSSTCSNGDEEMSKADQVTDSADKLFHIRRALRLCPTNSNYHLTLSDLYLSLNRKDDAIFEAKEALRIDSSNSAATEKLEQLQQSSASASASASARRAEPIAGSIAAAKEPKLPGSGGAAPKRY